MIKAIIFDIGNVLLNFNNDIFLEKISILNGKSKEENFKLIYKESGLPIKYETGLINSSKFHKEISKLCKIDISLLKLKEIYTKDKLSPVLGMIEIVKELKKKYLVSLLSNSSEWDYEFGVKKLINTKIFNTITTSYKVKAMKPSPDIFINALTKLKLKPEECLYIDDIYEYILAADKLGFNTIHFTNVENFKILLNKFNINLNN